MDLHSAMLLMGHEVVDPSFSEKIASHIDRYGAINIDEGQIINRHKLMFALLKGMYEDNESLADTYPEDADFIKTNLEDMLSIATSIAYSYPDNEPLLRKRFNNDGESILYALESVENRADNLSYTDREKALTYVFWIEQSWLYLADSDECDSRLYFVDEKKNVTPLDKIADKV